MAACARAGSVPSSWIRRAARPELAGGIRFAASAMAEPATAAPTATVSSRQDEQLLAPLAPEQPERPPQHGAARRPFAAHDAGLAGQQRLGAGRRDGLVDEAPVAQEDDPVGPRREVRLVGHHHAGRAAVAGLAQQAHDGLAVDRVERAGRLVGQEQLALADDGAGDGDPLALAAGQVVGEVLGPLGRRRAGRGRRGR